LLDEQRLAVAKSMAGGRSCDLPERSRRRISRSCGARSPGWLHEIKFDGYRVIARKDGERFRLWARTTSDYSNAFTSIRDAVAALPVESAVLDAQAVLLRPDNPINFLEAALTFHTDRLTS
jgi:bifunctional non-homologous end joining protein LigD